MSGGVVVVEHPVLAHRVAQLRDRDTGGDGFRQLVSEVSALLAYEALRDLGTTEVTVDTPVATGAPPRPGPVPRPRSVRRARRARNARREVRWRGWTRPLRPRLRYFCSLRAR